MYDILIIGAGPAGMTAALYAARAGKQVLLLEKEFPGGQIVNSPLVENYPAIPGVSGADFAMQLQEQVTALGVKLSYVEVDKLEKTADGFRVNGDEDLTARAAILATGVSHRGLGLPGEEDLVGAGLSFCAVCDGAFYRGRTAVVVGGGDTALQDAVYLSALCKKVYVVHRRDAFRAAEALVRKARSKENIEFVTPYVPVAYLTEDDMISGLELESRADGSRRVLETEGIFLAVGQAPQCGFAAGLAELTPDGYVRAGEDCLTNIPGLFTAGDCRVKKVRQLTTAVGDGAVAATAACEYLDNSTGM
ncbi:MAG: FAD-dependent oxidoreductase [Lachnospiraceae bacterium]|nr:FAD-dependent oxidoreductase [Lachnospiraceae bacterium]